MVAGPTPPSRVSVDHCGLPVIRLAANHNAPDHTVVFEELYPVLRGYCATCRENWPSSRVAERKARSCGVMVRYLSYLNRDRVAAEAIRNEARRALTG